ncbi:hypothetical protein V8G54_004948 [Vigna mungo]|uniref:Uncharacterized protein n=1 Tax=Vigna mungo TaxID=3915 RepID=A0AAQ3SGN8_VIGMU
MTFKRNPEAHSNHRWSYAFVKETLRRGFGNSKVKHRNRNIKKWGKKLGKERKKRRRKRQKKRILVENDSKGIVVERILQEELQLRSALSRGQPHNGCSGHAIPEKHRRSTTRDVNSFAPSVGAGNQTSFSGGHRHSVFLPIQQQRPRHSNGNLHEPYRHLAALPQYRIVVEPLHGLCTAARRIVAARPQSPRRDSKAYDGTDPETTASTTSSSSGDNEIGDGARAVSLEGFRGGGFDNSTDLSTDLERESRSAAGQAPGVRESSRRIVSSSESSSREAREAKPKKPRRETMAAVSEGVTAWRGVEVRILSRQRWRRKYATEKNTPKKTALVSGCGGEGIVFIELLGFDAVTGGGKGSTTNVHFPSGSDGGNADGEGNVKPRSWMEKEERERFFIETLSFPRSTVAHADSGLSFEIGGFLMFMFAQEMNSQLVSVSVFCNVSRRRLAEIKDALVLTIAQGRRNEGVGALTAWVYDSDAIGDLECDLGFCIDGDEVMSQWSSQLAFKACLMEVIDEGAAREEDDDNAIVGCVFGWRYGGIARRNVWRRLRNSASLFCAWLLLFWFFCMLEKMMAMEDGWRHGGCCSLRFWVLTCRFWVFWFFPARMKDDLLRCANWVSDRGNHDKVFGWSWRCGCLRDDRETFF